MLSWSSGPGKFLFPLDKNLALLLQPLNFQPWSLRLQVNPAHIIRILIRPCGSNINKTAIFLQALVSHSKPFIYFALDVSYGELERNLARLAYKIPQHRGSINGLCGTYDDLIRALDGPLARLRSCEMTYLWFGNSFTNAQPESSVAFLSKLLAGSCSHPTQKSPRLQALVAIDGCRDAKRVLEAYGTHTTVHRDFLFHGLDHANKVLGQDVFVEDHWGVSTQFDESSGLLLQKFVAKGSMELSIDGRRLQIGRGEEINICQSGKWEQSEVKLMANAGGLKIVGEWHHEDGDYGESSHTRFEVHGMSRLLARKRQGMRTDRA